MRAGQVFEIGSQTQAPMADANLQQMCHMLKGANVMQNQQTI